MATWLKKFSSSTKQDAPGDIEVHKPPIASDKVKTTEAPIEGPSSSNVQPPTEQIEKPQKAVSPFKLIHVLPRGAKKERELPISNVSELKVAENVPPQNVPPPVHEAQANPVGKNIEPQCIPRPVSPESQIAPVTQGARTPNRREWNSADPAVGYFGLEHKEAMKRYKQVEIQGRWHFYAELVIFVMAVFYAVAMSCYLYLSNTIWTWIGMTQIAGLQVFYSLEMYRRIQRIMKLDEKSANRANWCSIGKIVGIALLVSFSEFLSFVATTRLDGGHIGLKENLFLAGLVTIDLIKLIGHVISISILFRSIAKTKKMNEERYKKLTQI